MAIMVSPHTFALLSILVVSGISLIGIVTFSIKNHVLSKLLTVFVAIATGALLGDAFIHLIPEAGEVLPLQEIGLYILVGIAVFFILEKFLHWHHHHETHEADVTDCHDCDHHIRPFGTLIIVSDIFHNVLDGAIIAASYFISVEVGIATTIAIALHEIPQEIGDFGVLLHAGYSKAQALVANFASALSAFFGAIVVFFIGTSFETWMPALSAIAAGGFIYIAIADLIPELHKDTGAKRSLVQFLFVALGVLAMLALTLFE